MAWYCPRCSLTANVAGTCSRDGAALVPVGAQDLIGKTIDEYRIVARVGGGGFSHVYRAMHVRSELPVALKLLTQPIEHADSQRAITEARSAAAIRHPNVVQVYDFGTTDERRPYIVMEYLDGTSLAQRWHGPVPADQVVPVAIDILRGLRAAHKLGIVHRDLKPANVFIAKERAVIVDFGLAKLITDPNRPNFTVTGETVGTPRYMSPEQIQGKPIDGRSDLYSLGVMLFEAIAGEPPFDAASTYQLFTAHVENPPPALPRGVPRRLVAVIDRALAKDPGERYADADEMRRALDGKRRPRRWWSFWR